MPDDYGLWLLVFVNAGLLSFHRLRILAGGLGLAGAGRGGPPKGARHVRALREDAPSAICGGWWRSWPVSSSSGLPSLRW